MWFPKGEECPKGGGPFMSLILSIWFSTWVFPKIGVPQNGWFMMENPLKKDGWFGGISPYFRKHPNPYDSLRFPPQKKIKRLQTLMLRSHSSREEPMGSMYGIFTYIWLKCLVNVGRYNIHGSYGETKRILLFRDVTRKRTVSESYRTYPPDNRHFRPWKWMVGRWYRFLLGPGRFFQEQTGW